MSRIEKRYWQTFNISARAVGCGFICAGINFTLWGLSLLLDKKATIDADGVPTTDPWLKAIFLIVGLVVLVLGLFLVLARRYRPDLGDSAFTAYQKDSSNELEKHDGAA